MNGMTAFVVVAGGLSAICYWLMRRTQNIGARRSSPSRDRTSNDYSYGSSGNSSGGWNISNLFSRDNSNASSDESKFVERFLQQRQRGRRRRWRWR